MSDEDLIPGQKIHESVGVASAVEKMSMQIYRSENHGGVSIPSALEKMPLPVSQTHNYGSVTAAPCVEEMERGTT
jgi:hypothetical protein